MPQSPPRQMHTYDLFMVVVLFGAAAWGFHKGLAWQIASLASLVASYFVAYNFRDPLASMISTDAPWNMFLAMLILFIGTSLVIWLAFRFVSEFIERMKLREFDRQIGALVGLGKGVLLCVVITLFAVTLLGPDQRSAIVGSRSGHYIAEFLDRSHAMFPKELHDIVHPYLENLDPQLGKDHHNTSESGGVPASITVKKSSKKTSNQRRDAPSIGIEFGSLPVRVRLRPGDQERE